MLRNNYKHIVVDTFSSTAGGDVLVRNGHIYAGKQLLFKMDDIDRESVTKEVAIAAVTLGAIRFTVGANPEASTTYTLQIKQPNPGHQGAQNDPLVFNFSVITAATGETAITLADKFRVKFASFGTTYFTVDAAGSAIINITGVTAYPIIFGDWIEEHSGTASVYLLVTLGIFKRGLVANMVTQGLTGIGGYQIAGITYTTTASLAGTAYTLYQWLEYRKHGESNADRNNLGAPCCLWVNEGVATSSAAFVLALDNVLVGGTLTSATTANVNDDAVGTGDTIA